jgi:hypothetical protein
MSGHALCGFYLGHLVLKEISMEWKSISRISMVVIPVVIVCGLLVAASSMGPTARADNEDKMVCTDKTIQGDYGSQIIGTVLGPNLPFVA